VHGVRKGCGTDPAGRIREVAEAKLTDPNLTVAEAAWLRRRVHGRTGQQGRRSVAGRGRVRETDHDGGGRSLRIIRRSTGAVAPRRRAQMLLLSAQDMGGAKIAEVAFTSTDRSREEGAPGRSDPDDHALSAGLSGMRRAEPSSCLGCPTRRSTCPILGPDRRHVPQSIEETRPGQTSPLVGWDATPAATLLGQAVRR
jgi:hypothetical protein